MPNLNSSTDGMEENQMESNDNVSENKSEALEWEIHYGTRSKRWRMDKTELSRDDETNPTGNSTD